MNEALSLKILYELIHLAEFEPEDRYARRHWLDYLGLSFPTKTIRLTYGGNMSTMNFAWRFPLNGNFDETRNLPTILQVSNDLPTFHKREMHKDFIKKYSRTVTTSKSTLRNIYQNLTGGSSTAASKAQPEKQKQIAMFVSEQDEPDVLLDLHVLNGKPNCTKYDRLWDKIQALFNEYETTVHERCHGNTSYLPLAISTRELVERVKSRKPNIDVPSTE